MSMRTPLDCLQVEQAVHQTDGDRPLRRNGLDDIGDDGNQDLAIGAAVDDPHVVCRGLHNLADDANLAVALIDDAAADELVERGVEGSQLEIIAIGQHVAPGKGLRLIQVARAGKRTRAPSGTGETASTVETRSRLRAGGVRCTFMPRDSKKGRPRSGANEDLPFVPCGRTTRAMFL